MITTIINIINEYNTYVPSIAEQMINDPNSAGSKLYDYSSIHAAAIAERHLGESSAGVVQGWILLNKSCLSYIDTLNELANGGPQINHINGRALTECKTTVIQAKNNLVHNPYSVHRHMGELACMGSSLQETLMESGNLPTELPPNFMTTLVSKLRN